MNRWDVTHVWLLVASNPNPTHSVARQLLDCRGDAVLACGGDDADTSRNLELDQITEEDWHNVQNVNGYSAFLARQKFSPKMAAQGGGEIVLTGALDRSQSIPAPVHLAARQGLLLAMTMALAKELGPKNIRINLVCLGPLEDGLSRAVAPQLVEDYKTFSALRRAGRPEEVARAIVWLALENTYMNGKVLRVNGGI